MQTCDRTIGRWIPHRCGGEIVGGRCKRCGADATGRPGTDPSEPILDDELSFNDEELRRLEVVVGGEADANPPEWGIDPFRDFT